MPTEIELIKDRYVRRAGPKLVGQYSYLNPAVCLAVQERQRALLRWIRRSEIAPLAGRRLLEIGCGAGQNFFDFLRFGFEPENLVGNELLAERVEIARRLLPAKLRIVPGDAMEIDLPRESFDIVFQSAVFTSILDGGFQAALAARMWDWVTPGGGILWYDFVYDNPSNPDVAGVPLRRIRNLFPAGEMRYSRLTLAPPLARVATRIHPSLYSALNTIPFFRTHVLCWIRKPVASGRCKVIGFHAQAVCRTLGVPDLDRVAAVHAAAFPDKVLTSFGRKLIMKYYAWHMTGPHGAGAIGVESGGTLIGFCVMLHYNNFPGFLKRQIAAIAWALLRSPSLAIRRGFLTRIRSCSRLLFGKTVAGGRQPGTVRILSIAVSPEHQGAGFGQMLLQAAAGIAATHGATHLGLTVHPDNARAIRAYERDGWERIPIDGVWTGAMRKCLAPVRENARP